MTSGNRLFRYGETAVFCLLFFYAGLSFRPADPFLFYSAFQAFIPFALIVTLAGGNGAGLVALAFAAALSYFYYSPYPYSPLLWTALISLTAGEFKTYWERKIHMYSEERDYFREKLRDLTRNFILLKMSHERLEKSYILRPVSIRSSLEQIRGMLLKDEHAASQSLLDFLANFYGLESSALFIRRSTGGRCLPQEGIVEKVAEKVLPSRGECTWEEAARTGLGAEMDPDDPLIRLVAEKREAAFFTASQLREKNGSRYIAVIPYFGPDDEEPQAVLAVRQIPFLQLNKDNLLTISLYLSYFMGEFTSTERFSAAAAAFPKLDPAVFREMDRLLNLQRRFGVDSVLIAFKAEYGAMSREVSSFIESEIRGFDLSYAMCGESCVVLVLLPLTSFSNASVFIERVEAKVRENFSSFDGSLKKKAAPVAGDGVLPLLNKLLAQE